MESNKIINNQEIVWNTVMLSEILIPYSEKHGNRDIEEFSVTNKGILPRSEKFDKKLSKSSSNNKILRKGDLVFGNSRKVLNFDVMPYKIGSVSSAYKIFKINQEIVNPFYLRMYMKNNVEQFLDIIKPGTRDNQSIDPLMLMRKKIIIPPLEIQEYILEVVEILQEKIRINNGINAVILEMIQLLYKEWFVKYEFKNELNNSYRSNGGEMKDSELGQIPIQWEVRRLGEFCSISSVSEKPYNNPKVIYEHFSIPAYDDERLPYLELGEIINSNKYKIANGDILISKLNPTMKRIWDPYCLSENSICSTEFIVYKCHDKCIRPYIYEVINSDTFKEFLVSKQTGTTGSRQRVKPRETLDFKIAVPSKEVILGFCNCVEPLQRLVKENLQQNRKLKELCKEISPRLTSGELNVTSIINIIKFRGSGHGESNGV